MFRQFEVISPCGTGLNSLKKRDVTAGAKSRIKRRRLCFLSMGYGIKAQLSLKYLRFRGREEAETMQDNDRKEIGGKMKAAFV